MFLALKPLAKSLVKLTITVVVGEDDVMKVCVLPTVAAGKDAALAQPLVLRGTPEELNDGFIDALSQFQSVRLTLAEQVAATSVILDEAKKVQEALAVKTIKGKPATSVPSKAKAVSTGDGSEEVDGNDDENDDVVGEQPAIAPSIPEVKKAPAVHVGTDLSSLI